MVVRGTVGRIVAETFLPQHSSDELESYLLVEEQALVEFPRQSPDLRRCSIVASGIPMVGWDSERYTWVAHSEAAERGARDVPNGDHSFWGACGNDSLDQAGLDQATAFR